MAVIIANKLDHPVITVEAPIASILAGQGYVFQHIFEDVPNNAIRYVSMRTGDKQAFLEVVTDAEGKSYFKSYEDTVWTADGTLHETFNRRIRFLEQSECKIYVNGTPGTLGKIRFDKLILGGSGPQSSGSSSGIPKTSVMPPHSELTIAIQNISGNVKDIGITIEWAESKVLNDQN